jgi:NhaP-type Na+/H+ or K+/H+ antiporter
MLVSTTVLITIVSAVSLGVVSGYLAICGILRLFGRRRSDDPNATQVLVISAHASGD